MILKHFLMISCWLMLAVACSPTPSEETAARSNKNEEETKGGDRHDKDVDRDADHHVESDHDAGHNGDHDRESDHGDDSEEAHDDHEDHHAGEHEHGDHEKREHGAHEHGHATLTIAWSGTDIAIDLQTPAYNILGFEYAPSTDAEKKLLAASIAKLETETLMQLSPEAECVVVDADVETEWTEAEHGAEDDHGEGEGTHSEFEVFYSVQCKKPDELAAVDASGLFAAFPNFKAIRAQWISDRGQSAQTLTAKDSALSFD